MFKKVKKVIFASFIAFSLIGLPACNSSVDGSGDNSGYNQSGDNSSGGEPTNTPSNPTGGEPANTPGNSSGGEPTNTPSNPTGDTPTNTPPSTPTNNPETKTIWSGSKDLNDEKWQTNLTVDKNQFAQIASGDQIKIYWNPSSTATAYKKLQLDYAGSPWVELSGGTYGWSIS